MCDLELFSKIRSQIMLDYSIRVYLLSVTKAQYLQLPDCANYSGIITALLKKVI